LSKRWDGNPHFVECKVRRAMGSLSREVLAINMVMAGCKPNTRLWCARRCWR